MKSESINNQLERAGVMVQNARQHPLIQQQLVDWGYAAQKIAQGETLLQDVQLAQQAQKDSYYHKLDCNRQWKIEWATLQRQYSEHRSVAKTAFRNEPETLMRLRVDRAVARRNADLLDQATDFYTVITGKSKEMQKYGIKPDELTQTQAIITSLSALQAQRLQCKGNAESATQKRNEALKKLRVWQREFTRVARMALKDDPQLLEVLGIVVVA